MDKEVLIALLAEGVKLNRWKITKVPKELQGKVSDKVKKDKQVK